MPLRARNKPFASRAKRMSTARALAVAGIALAIAFIGGMMTYASLPPKPVSAVGIAICDTPVGAIVVYSDGTQRRITGEKMRDDAELQKLIEDAPAEKLGILKLCPQPAKPQVY